MAEQESRLAVTIDSRDAQRDAKSMTKDLNAMEAAGNKVDPAMRKAGASMDDMGQKASSSGSKVRGLEGSTGRLISTVSGLAAPLAAAFSAAKIVAAAEQYTNLTNRLRLVTEGTEQLAYAQQSVYDIAQNSRQSLETTAQVYQRIAQNGRQLGLSFEDVAKVTETVAKTVALSGSSAQAADAAMVQFGQALASGTLRGDELNSILEQTPALAQAIARGLGVTIGQLRSLGAEGKLTSAAIVEALQKQKDQVDQLSSSLNLTVGQAITAFNNALVATVGRLDEAAGASSRLANGIASLARAMDGFNSGEFLDFFRADKQTVAGLNNELGVTLAGIRDLQGARARLSKDDSSDTVLFKFRFYDRKELDAQISELEGKAGTIRTIVTRMEKSASSIGDQKPAGEGPAAPVNAEFDKLLASLKKQAALQGQNSEAAKVRYAIETGEIGKLLPEQEKLLLKYAEEKDAKVAAEKATKSAAAATAKAQAAAGKGVPEALSTFAKLYAQYDPAAEAARALQKEQVQLQLAMDKGKISQEEYGKALAQASTNYAAAIKGAQGLTQAEQYRAQLEKQLSTQRTQYSLEAAGVGMGDQQSQRLQQRVQLEQQTNDRILQLRTELANATTEKQRQDLQAQIALTQEFLPKQQAALTAGWAQMDQAMLSPLNGWTAALQNFQASATNVAGQTQSMFTGAFSNITTSVGSAFEKMTFDGQTFGESATQVIRGLAGGVVNSLGQMAAQWLVNQGIQLAFGQTSAALAAQQIAQVGAVTAAEATGAAAVATAKVAADGVATASSVAATATTTAVQTAAAGTTLAAWLPAALVASIGSFGAAAVVGGGALLAAFALIKGFESGGYTGGGGRKAPAGIVHGQEFVVNAEGTRRNRSLLEAINSGERVSMAGSSVSVNKVQGAETSQQQGTQVSLTVNLIEDKANAGKVSKTTSEDGQSVLQICVASIMGDGELYQAMSSKFGMAGVGS
ncbi:tape measure protein [Pseudomonas sp. WMBT8]|uniref:tape measure protein n=1 Tax=Pseudomonas sp. WMBT8 TaxID=3414496 RepID=UPI003D808CBE